MNIILNLKLLEGEGGGPLLVGGLSGPKKIMGNQHGTQKL